jgi:hypothetical protein
VNFAALLHGRAGVNDQPLLDHLLVDDYQDTTLAAEAIVAGLAPPDLIVALTTGARTTSRSGSDRHRSAGSPSGSAAIDVIELTTHRANRRRQAAAPHTSEEHAASRASAHDGRGRAVEQARVVVRQQAHCDAAARARRCRRAACAPSGMALTAERPRSRVLALRWLTADADARER